MSNTIEEKVQKLEHHVNEKLRRDLKNTIDAGDVIYAEISEYLQLRNLLEKMRESNLPVENVNTMVDVGCNIYVKGVIPSVQRIFVDIGLGFHLECDHKEALQIVEHRVDFLTSRTNYYRDKANNIRAHIKLFLQGLREIQGLNPTAPTHKDVFA